MSVNYNPSVVTSGLILNLDAGNLKSYPTSGTAWTDLSRNANNGTLINGPTYNAGSIVFNGTNHYVEKSSPASMPIGNSEISASAWFYYSGTANTFSVITSYGGGSATGDSFSLALNISGNYDINCQFNGATGCNSSTGIYSPNVWNHFAATKTAGPINTTTKMYLNGNLISIASSTTNTPSFVATVLRISRWTHVSIPYYFNGRISNVNYYNRALSAAEVLQNYNALRGRYGL